MVMQKLTDPGRGKVGATAPAKAGAYRGITVEALNAKWHETVLILEKLNIKVINAKNALEGALLIRYTYIKHLQQHDVINRRQSIQVIATHKAKL